MQGRVVLLSLGVLGLVACNLVLGIEDAETIPGTGGEGASSSCGIDADCKNDNPCTEDRCIASACQHIPLDGVDAPEQTAGDCSRVVCLSGEASNVADDADRPDDGNDCTGDACENGMPRHDALEGATCSQPGAVVCNDDGDCVECINNSYCTLPETCGGGGAQYGCGCTPTTSCTAEGLSCGALDNGCGFISCNNGMDGAETDVDCGGPVSACNIRCAADKMCLVNSDCASNSCSDLICD
jgi:hypothetical protein